MKLTEKKLCKILEKVGIGIENQILNGDVIVDNESYTYNIVPDMDEYIIRLKENGDEIDWVSFEGLVEVCGKEICDLAQSFDFKKIFKNDLFKLNISFCNSEIDWRVVLN
ncbi:hypothetical protein ACSW8S_19490 (plasmid) [Clostridium perfringens]